MISLCLSFSSGVSSVSSFSTVFMSTSPRCFDLSRYLSSVSGGWMGSNSSVASLPCVGLVICSGGGWLFAKTYSVFEDNLGAAGMFW